MQGGGSAWPRWAVLAADDGARLRVVLGGAALPSPTCGERWVFNGEEDRKWFFFYERIAGYGVLL